MHDDMSVPGVIVTGGASGIGKATIDLLQEYNYIIIVVDIKKIQKPKKSNVHFLHLDVSKEKSWQIITSYIKKLNIKINALINNAGISGDVLGNQNPENISLVNWNKILCTNLTSAFLGSKYLIRIMKNYNTSCSIVNVASRSGFVGMPNLCAYSASKAAMINLTKSIALYCASKNYKIRCNYIAPASIKTSMWDAIINSQEDLDSIEQDIPLGRMGTAREVANAIFFIISNKAQYITGSGIVVDGGILSGTTASPTKNRW